MRLAFLISSAVSNFHQKRYNNGDFKENCRKLAEMILPVLQQGTKRSANRDFQSRWAFCFFGLGKAASSFKSIFVFLRLYTQTCNKTQKIQLIHSNTTLGSRIFFQSVCWEWNCLLMKFPSTFFWPTLWFLGKSFIQDSKVNMYNQASKFKF